MVNATCELFLVEAEEVKGKQENKMFSMKIR